LLLVLDTDAPTLRFPFPRVSTIVELELTLIWDLSLCNLFKCFPGSGTVGDGCLFFLPDLVDFRGRDVRDWLDPVKAESTDLLLLLCLVFFLTTTTCSLFVLVDSSLDDSSWL